MNKYYLKGNSSGRYFVLGRGFTASCKSEASQLTQAQVDGAIAAGFEPATKELVVASKSFAVNYVRQKDLDGRGGVNANTRNPSKRRFATNAEAVGHGRRWTEKEGHLGFYVTQTTDKVNSRFDGALTYKVA